MKTKMTEDKFPHIDKTLQEDFKEAVEKLDFLGVKYFFNFFNDKIDVNYPDDLWGNTPIFQVFIRPASWYQNKNNIDIATITSSRIQIAKLLVEKGARISKKNWQGELPIIYASMLFSEEPDLRVLVENIFGKSSANRNRKNLSNQSV